MSSPALGVKWLALTCCVLTGCFTPVEELIDGGRVGGGGGSNVGGGTGAGLGGGGGAPVGGGTGAGGGGVPVGGGGGVSCDGCVFPNGICIPLSSTSVVNCGARGEMCRACGTGQLCTRGVCSGGVGGGGGGGVPVGGGAGGGVPVGGGSGGGGPTCDGCVSQGNTCVPLRNTTATNCGFGGMVCRACSMGQTCTQGVCTQVTMQRRVGDACANNTECQQGLGASAICKKTTSSGNATYQGGYCTLLCGAAAMCPSGSSCVSVPQEYGERDALCWDNCSTNDLCRTPGYGCYGLGTGSACWISPLPPVGGGGGGGGMPVGGGAGGGVPVGGGTGGGAPVGGGAGGGVPVGGGTGGGVPVGGGTGGGVPVGGGGGGTISCSAATCPLGCCVGNTCVSVQQQSAAACGLSGVQCKSCLDGATCNFGACSAADAGTSTVGRACTSDPQCKPPSNGFCIAENILGQPTGWPGGACTASCTTSQCPTGSSCIEVGSNSGPLCFENCPAPRQGQSTCRSGYLCEVNAQTAFSGMCLPRCTSPGFQCWQGTVCNATSGYCVLPGP